MTLDDWIINGETGVSSKVIWACLKDVKIHRNYGDIPYDPDDFSRCYKFFKECNLTFPELYIVSEKLPHWKPFIDNWEILSDMYEENVKTNWHKSDEIGMYAFMKTLEKESNSIFREGFE
jgi:hypothetical protein